MHNKTTVSVALILVLLQIFLLFLPVIRSDICVRDYDVYGNQSVFQMIGDMNTS